MKPMFGKYPKESGELQKKINKLLYQKLVRYCKKPWSVPVLFVR